jgi:hypothetical protein
MEENLQQSKFIIIMKKIWPATIRVINIIFYTIFSFIRNSVKYIIDQIKNY